MNNSFFEYYKKDFIAGFEDIIFVKPFEKSFEELQKIAPSLPKAWIELSTLDIKDKIEFSKMFTLKTLPFIPGIYEKIDSFFESLEDIFVVISKKIGEEIYLPELVYTIKNSSVFFRGRPPLKEEEISNINRDFKEILPKDFLRFLLIHNGFSKNADIGLIEGQNILNITNYMQSLIEENKKNIKINGEFVDSRDLIFFYQSFEKGEFQCFYTRYFSDFGIGNVNYSFSDDKISDFKSKDSLSFSTFLHWLVFYLDMEDF